MDAAMPDVILRWLQYASSFDFEVAYRPGKNHENADGLSRPPYHAHGCDKQDCICIKSARKNARALEQFHEEPDFEACEGI